MAMGRGWLQRVENEGSRVAHTRVPRGVWTRARTVSPTHCDREAVAERAHRRRRSRRNFTARQSTRYEKIITSSVRATSAYEGWYPGLRRGARSNRDGRRVSSGEFSCCRKKQPKGRRRGTVAARRGREAVPPTRSRRTRDRDGEIQLKILHITRYTAKMYLLFKSGRDRGGLLALARTRDSRT